MLSLQRPQDPYISIGLNNLVARETRVEVDHDKPFNSRTPTPSPADKQRYNLWPVIKKAVSSNLMESSGRMAHKLTGSQSSPSLREFEPGCSFDGLTKSRLQKDRSLVGRRNNSIPELGTPPIIPSRRHYMDSPTIPGRFPVHERSNSAPGVPVARNPFQETLLAPVTEPVVLFDDHGFLLEPVDDKQQYAAAKPPVTEQELPKDSNDSTGTTTKPKIKLEMPPAVPPKSPRMVTRSPSVSQRVTASRYTSPTKRNPSPIDENSPTGDAVIDTTTHIATQWRAPAMRPRAATATDFRPSESTSSRIHQRSESASAGTAPITETSERPQARDATKKELSESPIIDRGRPTRQHSPAKNGPVNESPTKDYAAFSSLPSGFTPSEAAPWFSQAEIERLQHQARGQVEKFEVLKYRDVKSLSQELRLLDERCEYLRNTHKSLRSGRQALHDRMIGYLRSPILSKFTRESMLRQQEALAELDESISEWITKLELFENRRTRVRQKLLEHLAAALILQVTSRAHASEPHTPPQSPIQGDENGVEIHRQESIKVYADSKVYADANVHALFAEIEREMELMNESRKGASRQETQATATTAA